MCCEDMMLYIQNKKKSWNDNVKIYIAKSFVNTLEYDGHKIRIIDIFINPQLSSVALIRMQQYFFWKHKNCKLINRKFYSFMTTLTARANYILNGGIEVSAYADIAPGLNIHHSQGIIIGGDSKIGRNCHLYKNILLGVKNNIYPTIMNNVIIYANAVVIGHITIHDNAVIAPNSVVIKGVDTANVVSGIPAKVIK